VTTGPWLMMGGPLRPSDRQPVKSPSNDRYTGTSEVL